MQPVETEANPIDYELEKLHSLQRMRAQIEADYAAQTELVYQMLTDLGLRSMSAEGFKYTIVQAERTKIHESSLRRAIGARLFNKLTVRKIDQKLVTEAVKTGQLDPVVLSMHSENVLNKPYIRITEMPLDDDG